MKDKELANKALTHVVSGNAVEFNKAMSQLIGLKLSARINTERENILSNLAIR